MVKTLVKTITIEDTLAECLSRNLAAYKVLTDIYMQMNDGEKRDQIFDKLCETSQSIDVLKNTITTDCIPTKYQTDQYEWEFKGYHINGPKIDIYSLYPVDDDTDIK